MSTATTEREVTGDVASWRSDGMARGAMWVAPASLLREDKRVLGGGADGPQ